MKNTISILVCLLFCANSLAQSDETRFQSWRPDHTGLDFQLARAEAIDDILVPAEEPGVLEKMLVKRGDLVKVDQLISELNKRQYEIQERAASIERRIAEFAKSDTIDREFAVKSRELAAKVLQRSEEANADYENTITKTEIDRLELDYQRSDLSEQKAERDLKVAADQAELRLELEKEATLRLEKRDIKSPIDGLVAEVFARQGEWVSAGAPIMRIVNLEKLRVKAFAKAMDHNYRDLIGKTVTFKARPPGSRGLVEIEGKITFASPEINYEVGDFEIWAELQNVNGMIPPGTPGLLRLKTIVD